MILLRLIVLFGVVIGKNTVRRVDKSTGEYAERAVRQNNDNQDLPEPIFLIVGESGAGKSSLARALSGVDPKCRRNCPETFAVCGRRSLDSCTSSTNYRTTNWLGVQNYPMVTIVDTPGFGDAQGRDDQLQEEMMKTLKEKVKSANAIILLIKATETRFGSGVQNMLKKMEVLFGKKMWDHVIISFSFWTYSEDDVKCREESASSDESSDSLYDDWSEDYYEDDCTSKETEDDIKEKFINQFKEHFTAEPPMVFVDIFAKRRTKKIKNDSFRQNKFNEEAKKLFDFARNHEGFKFKTVDDILQENEDVKKENIRLKRDISELNNTIHSKIKNLENKLDSNSKNITTITNDVKDNKKEIGSNSGKINTNTKDIQQNKKEIDSNSGKINTNTKGIQQNKNRLDYNRNKINTNTNNVQRNKNRIDSNSRSMTSSTRDISSLKEKTSRFVSYCGYKSVWWSSSTGRVTYNRLATSVNSFYRGGLSTSTGVFTTPTHGTYLITYNFYTSSSGSFNVFINYNGQNLYEGLIGSSSTDDDRDMTGRTLTKQLNTNDKLYLHVNRNDGDIHTVTFCITLLH